MTDYTNRTNAELERTMDMADDDIGRYPLHAPTVDAARKIIRDCKAELKRRFTDVRDPN